MYQSVVLLIPARLASAFVMLRIRSRVATSSCLLSSKGRGIELECFSSRVGETLRLCIRQRTCFLDKPFLNLPLCYFLLLWGSRMGRKSRTILPRPTGFLEVACNSGLISGRHYLHALSMSVTLMHVLSILY